MIPQLRHRHQRTADCAASPSKNMPEEKRKRGHSEHSPQEPPQDGKSLSKQKKQKSGSEKKRKRKHERDELRKVQESAAQLNKLAGDVVMAESTDKKKKGGDDDAEIIIVDDVNEASLSKSEETRKKKKKKKKKERKADSISNHASEEKQAKSVSEPAEPIKKNDQEDTEGPVKKPNGTESPKVGNKRKKNKKNRKCADPSGEGEHGKQAVVDKEIVNVEKGPQSGNVFRSHDGPGDEPHTDDETLKKDLTDGADKVKPKQNETSLDNASKQKGKKRKREGQRCDCSDQPLVKDWDREPREAKQERLPKKRVKREQNAASNPLNAQKTGTRSLSGDETLSSQPTKEGPKSETPSGASAKEESVEPSGDQEEEDTPLDDTRLPRTLFVGNVPHTANRKELRKMFAKFGPIESIRIRNVIPDNPKVPKKAALLAKRLAKFSNSFSAYVVFKEVPDMDQVLQSAVTGTNMTIFQDHHLRVTKALQTKGRRRLSIFIGNLPFDCSDEELITTFMPIAQECGVNLLNVRVSRDSDTGVGRGVGFATFDDLMGIQACMNKAGEITLRGRVLRIERAFKTKMMKSKSYKRRRQAAFGRKA